ncbi:hypothetical protein BS78_10G205400 [Paspalum vaginatum]|nr:hypothetical protein BS78_10G205400 [Paspalum vaginatum]
MAGSLATTPISEEAQLAGETMKKWEEASASEAGDRGLERKEASAPEGFDILRKKKVMMALLAVHRKARSSEAVKGGWGWPAEAGKKRMKVVKKKLPKAVIDLMKRRPPIPTEIPEEDRMYYAWRSAQADYEKALIRQYEELGYAEDETEVVADDDY